MDVRSCSLGQRCGPGGPKKAEESFWWKVSALPRCVLAAAAQDVAEIAADVEAFVFARDADDFLVPKSAGAKAMEEVRQQASQLLADFCSPRSGLASAEPEDEELQELWSRCCVLFGCSLRPGPVAEALLQQLRAAPAPGCAPAAAGLAEGTEAEEEVRRRRLRALAALLHVDSQGEVGREISGHVARRGAGLLRRLAAASDEEVGGRAAEAMEVLGLLCSDSEADASPAPASTRSSGSGDGAAAEVQKAETIAPDATPSYGMARLGA